MTKWKSISNLSLPSPLVVATLSQNEMGSLMIDFVCVRVRVLFVNLNCPIRKESFEQLSTPARDGLV